MNAPFQARAGLRDPFTAFVSDDATADMLRPVAVEHGWSPEKVNKGGLRNAVQSLSVSASPNILFVDLSESADPLNDINALAEVCEPGTIVIAAGTVNDVRLYRDLVASGIHDYLLKPFTVDQLRDTFAHAQMILSGPRGESQADKPHVMAAVIGVRGGVRPPSLTSTCTSAPARWRSTSSLAAVLPTRSRIRAASTVCSSSARWFARTRGYRCFRRKRRSISRW
jgi:pilus assembly protein CpaE